MFLSDNTDDDTTDFQIPQEKNNRYLRFHIIFIFFVALVSGS